MSDGTKIPLLVAEERARIISDWTRRACQRIEIAGSIRRRKLLVGDIEIVCIPIQRTDFFGEPFLDVDAVMYRMADFTSAELLVGGNKYRKYNIDGVQLDLFITTPEQWGVIFMIRTGSANFSKLMVTARQEGGYCPSHMHFKDGWLWSGENKLDTPEERDVFKLLGVEWVEPRNRSFYDK